MNANIHEYLAKAMVADRLRAAEHARTAREARAARRAHAAGRTRPGTMIISRVRMLLSARTV